MQPSCNPNPRMQTLLFGTRSINPNNHQRRAPEPLAAVSDCHHRWSGRSSVSTWGPADDIGGGSFLPPSLQKSVLIKISTPGPYFYYRFTQPVRGLSIKAQINVDGSRWWQRRFWVLADRIANGWRSQLILLTIRSNLFHAKSSLKVSGGLTPYQQGVAAAVTLPPVAPSIIITHGWLTQAVAVQVMVRLQSSPHSWLLKHWSSAGQETIGWLPRWFGELASIAADNEMILSLCKAGREQNSFGNNINITSFLWQDDTQHCLQLKILCSPFLLLMDCDWPLLWSEHFHDNIAYESALATGWVD